MKKIIVYKTDTIPSDYILPVFSEAINKHIKGWQSECVNIENFIHNGIPKDVNAIATLGILRGTGHLLKEAAKNKIDRYYIDHAYFNPGYGGECWLRISKNKHTINYIRDVSSYRWDRFFTPKNTILPWKNFEQRGNLILIIPPTNAICWYFDDHQWTENLMNYLKKILNKETFNKIKIREKPKEPMVDENGNYLGLKQNSQSDTTPLDEDLQNSSIVIAYNSQVALDATLKGIPVIVDKHNSCFGVTFKLSDLEKGLDNPAFNIEPNRLKLCHWLSYCQYKLDEIKSGFAWKTINNFQN